MNKSHFDQVTCDIIPLVKRLKQNEMLRWILSVEGALVAQISFAEGALVAPPVEVPMEWQI